MKAVYLTNGASRKIKAGKRVIEFIKRSPRKMSYEGPVSNPVLIAIEELGEPNLTAEMTNKIVELFHQEEARLLKDDLKLAPKWIVHKFIPLLSDKLQTYKR